MYFVDSRKVPKGFVECHCRKINEPYDKSSLDVGVEILKLFTIDVKQTQTKIVLKKKKKKMETSVQVR